MSSTGSPAARCVGDADLFRQRRREFLPGDVVDIAQMGGAGALGAQQGYARAAGGDAFVVFPADIAVMHAAVGDQNLIVFGQGNVACGVGSVGLWAAVEEQGIVALRQQGDVLVHDTATRADNPFGVGAELYKILGGQR